MKVTNSKCRFCSKSKWKNCNFYCSQHQENISKLQEKEFSCIMFESPILKETNHDYQGCIVGNYYDNNCNGNYESWEDFRSQYLGFSSDGYDDTYQYVFRYDIFKSQDSYILELCIMLQRKGIYTHLTIKNISEDTLQEDVNPFLQDRLNYLTGLWGEFLK